MKDTKNHYLIEVTDTFAGEANYCWVKHFLVKSRSIRGAISKLSKTEGGNFRLDYGDSHFSRYSLKGSPVCAFVENIDSDDDKLKHINYKVI